MLSVDVAQFITAVQLSSLNIACDRMLHVVYQHVEPSSSHILSLTSALIVTFHL